MKSFKIIRENALGSLGVTLSNNINEVPVGQVCLANESMIVQSSFIQELTAWAIGYGTMVGDGLKTLRDHLAPTRPSTSRTIRLQQYDETEPWFTVDQTLVKRSLLGDFAEVRQRTATKVDRLVLNRGLSIVLDRDELAERPEIQQMHTKHLMDLLMRASVLEAVALYDASATVINTVWDAAANPDMEIQAEVIALGDITGFQPNRACYGSTASFKRRQAYQNQLTAGSLAGSTMLTDEQIAVSTGLGRVLTNADRYQSTTTAKKQIIGSNVYLFTALDDPSVEDPSNIVRHVANASFGGGEYAAYVTPVGVKKIILTVENYELFAAQHTTGIAKIVIA